MNYIDTHNRTRRFLIAALVTVLVNGWLIFALLHGNIYPFAAPQHLIRVRIFPNTKPVAHDRTWVPKGLDTAPFVPADAGALPP